MSAEVQAEIAELKEHVARYEVDRLVSQASAPAIPTDGLAQGDDPVELDYVVYDSGEYQELHGSWEYTWNEILSILAPMMFDEAPEARMRERLEADLVSQLRQDHPTEMLTMLTPVAQLDDKAWSQVIVQLRALGLIDRGEKRRAVADRSPYWKLTARGEGLLMRLMALPTGVRKASEISHSEVRTKSDEGDAD